MSQPNLHGDLHTPPNRCYEIQSMRLLRAPDCGALYSVEITVWEWQRQETIEFLFFYHDGIFEHGGLDESRNEILIHARSTALQWMQQNQGRRPLCRWNQPVIFDFNAEPVLVPEEDVMRFVFLDFDGVLNNMAAHQTRASMNHKYKVRIAQECVAPLEWLLRETKAQVVLSTSHRTDDVEMWTKALHEIGIPSARVVGSTPDLTRWPNNPDGTLTRGHEIDAWLDEAKACCSTVNYVILDDCDDMAMHKSHLVQTNLRAGLTMTEARRAAKMLLN